RGSTLTHVDWWRLLRSRPEVARGYEALAHGLQLAGAHQPVKRVLVTSAQPEEGKTTVTINLALTLAMAGKRTLLIDADLRKPGLHRALELENTRGFADIATGEMGPDDLDAVQVVEMTDGDPSICPGLSVITSGNASPGALATMGSARAKEALDRLATDYDLVLLDSPPVLAVSDALLLAPMVDGVLLVLKSGVVTEEEARRAKERLEEAGGHVLGLVLNHFNEGPHGPGVHPYGRYYQAE
ncbi:MAG: CpsD/CapB family tyrosine-protein kinase, partial [Candidatus Rokuibacteriota bacterium]